MVVFPAKKKNDERNVARRGPGIESLGAGQIYGSPRKNLFFSSVEIVAWPPVPARQQEQQAALVIIIKDGYISLLFMDRHTIARRLSDQSILLLLLGQPAGRPCISNLT